MATINPINFMSNRGGIPRLQSTGVNVTATDVQFSFNADATFSRNYSGLVLVRLAQAIPSGTTTTLPIVFTSSAGTQAVTTYNGAAVTVAEITGTGIYLLYYDRATNILQLI